jgi:hypothetical protein
MRRSIKEGKRKEWCKNGRLSGKTINPLTPNNWKRRRAVSPLKIKIPSKNMREKPTNATIIHSVY